MISFSPRGGRPRPGTAAPTSGRRHTDIQTCRRTDMQTYYTYRHTTHTDIQTYRHTDIQTCRHTDIQTYYTYRPTDIQTYRQMGGGSTLEEAFSRSSDAPCRAASGRLSPFGRASLGREKSQPPPHLLKSHLRHSPGSGTAAAAAHRPRGSGCSAPWPATRSTSLASIQKASAMPVNCGRTPVIICEITLRLRTLCHRTVPRPRATAATAAATTAAAGRAASGTSCSSRGRATSARRRRLPSRAAGRAGAANSMAVAAATTAMGSTTADRTAAAAGAGAVAGAAAGRAAWGTSCRSPRPRGSATATAAARTATMGSTTPGMTADSTTAGPRRPQRTLGCGESKELGKPRTLERGDSGEKAKADARIRRLGAVEIAATRRLRSRRDAKTAETTRLSHQGGDSCWDGVGLGDALGQKPPARRTFGGQAGDRSPVDKSLSETWSGRRLTTWGLGFNYVTFGWISMRFGLHEEDQTWTFEFDFKFNNLDSVLHRTYILRYEMRRLSRARRPQIHVTRLCETNSTV